MSGPRRVEPPGPTSVVACGLNHSLCVDPEGVVWAWGGNGSGQLGNDAIDPSPVPVRTLLDEPASGVAAGDGFSLALLPEGRVSAWGRNDMGQLCSATLHSIAHSLVPRTVPGLRDLVSIAAGWSCGYATNILGEWLTWGYDAGDDDPGELGIFTEIAHALEVTPASLLAVTRCREDPVRDVLRSLQVEAVAAGGEHSLALTSDGRVYAWGSNDHGQLGRNGTAGSGARDGLATPSPISALSGIVAVAAGDAHSLAVDGEGCVWAWGANAHGQLGDGTTEDRGEPAPVRGLAASRPRRPTRG